MRCLQKRLSLQQVCHLTALVPALFVSDGLHPLLAQASQAYLQPLLVIVFKCVGLVGSSARGRLYLSQLGVCGMPALCTNNDCVCLFSYPAPMFHRSSHAIAPDTSSTAQLPQCTHDSPFVPSQWDESPVPHYVASTPLSTL